MSYEPEPVYYDTVIFAGQKIELWRSHWTVKRTLFVRWYAMLEGMSEEQFHSTHSDTPGQAIGTAILLTPQNDELANRLWGAKGCAKP